MGGKFNNFAKNAAKHFAKQALKKAAKKILLNPYVLMFLGVVILIFVSVLILFNFLGGAYSDNIVADNGQIAKNLVNELQPPIISSNELEKEFYLPWGLPYALQLYARDWDDNLDREMIKNITKDLNPVFEYFDFDETTEVWESYTDENGNLHSKHYQTTTKKKYVLRVNTYAGIYTPVYKPFMSESETATSNYNKKTVTRFLAQTGMDFSPDWSRLDAAIVKYAYLNNEENNFNVEEHSLMGGEIILPFNGNYPITSPFGERIHPIDGTKRFHSGIDFGTPEGTPIKAVADGVVDFAGEYGGYGKAVIIKHTNGVVSLYGHLSEIKTKEGMLVKQGDVIGLSGNTGRSTGPHLHFEIRENGTPVDPQLYLSDIKNLPNGTVYYVSNIDRRMLLETMVSLMTNKENFDWLLEDELNDQTIPLQQEYDVNPSRIPDKYISVFKEAGEKYDISWTILAAIAYRESSFNPNAVGVFLPEYNTSALGMMHFLPETFEIYGVDGNKNGIVSPFEPEDAIYTAAHYLSANYNLYKEKGYSDTDALRKAVWHYNHAWWYVDQVMSIAHKYYEMYEGAIQK